MKLKSLISLIAIVGQFTYAASAPEEFSAKQKKLWAYAKTDRMMLSLSPSFKTSGPVYNIHNENQTEYSNNLTTIILQESHKMALPYLKAGDTKAYYALMVLGLTVPYHEGLYMHFRYRDNKAFGIDDNENPEDDNENFYKRPCQMEVNNGTKQKKENARATFREVILREKSPIALPCKELEGLSKLKQVIAGGGDGSDLGIMQITTSYWRKAFWSKDKIYSTRQTLGFGLNTVLFKNNNKGFGFLYANYADTEFAKCLQNEDKTPNMINIIKGTWVRYNGGQGKTPCRFTDEEDKYYENDVNFNRSLSRILRFGTEGDANQYLGYKDFGSMPLIPSPYLKKAIKQIVDNFKDGTNERDLINQVSGLNTSVE